MSREVPLHLYGRRTLPEPGAPSRATAQRRRRTRAGSCSFAITLAGLLAGCGAEQALLPPPGVPGPLSFIISQKETGPIVLVFPGRSAPTDDVTLGIRETCVRIAEKVEGSVALMSWKVYDQATDWVRREAERRRQNGEPARLALVGHSWGGHAAGNAAREFIAHNAVDEISVLVTIDAIKKGYGRCALNWLFAFASLEVPFGWRVPTMAYRDAPVADGTKLKRHLNYYQLDSAWLHAAAIGTADENHEVWFDNGEELGHGNLDNFILEIVAEDVRRAFLGGGV